MRFQLSLICGGLLFLEFIFLLLEKGFSDAVGRFYYFIYDNLYSGFSVSILDCPARLSLYREISS